MNARQLNLAAASVLHSLPRGIQTMQDYLLRDEILEDLGVMVGQEHPLHGELALLAWPTRFNPFHAESLAEKFEAIAAVLA